MYIDVCSDDSFWGFFGYGLDVHATLRGSDDDGGLRLTVHEDGEVEFPAGEFAFAYVDSIAKAPGRAGLLGHELVADHLVGEHFGFGRSVDRR